MDYNAYQQALTSAPAQAPTDNLSGASWGPALAKFMNVNFQNNATQGIAGATNAAQATRAKNDEQAAAAAKAAEIANVKQQAQDLKDSVDPKNFSIEKADDGGLRYFDGAGKQIDLNTYAKATGEDPSAVLKNSDNDLDRQFVADYSNMQKIVDAYANGDSKFFQDLKKNDPDTYNKIQQYGNASGLMKAFKQAYPNVYASGNDNNNARTGNPASFVNPLTQPQQQQGGGIGSYLSKLLGR